MLGRREPGLTELMRRIFKALANTGRIIEDWVRDEKELSNEPAVGRHVLGRYNDVVSSTYDPLVTNRIFADPAMAVSRPDSERES
jgi:hypothetical protein